MKKALLTLLLAFTAATGFAADKVPSHAYIEIETSLGSFKLELNGRQAPITVGHFLKLVDSGFYDGTIFHRVIPGFMAQGGGYTPGLDLKETDETIPNEAGNGNCGWPRRKQEPRRSSLATACFRSGPPIAIVFCSSGPAGGARAGLAFGK